MKHWRILQFLLAALLPTLAGCGMIGGSTDGVTYAAANTPLGGGDQISELRSQLASENIRAVRAEREAQRARAEADWLAQSALNEPGLKARNAEMKEEIARLQTANQRIAILEANLRDIAAENDKLSRALRGDWSEAPPPKTPTTPTTEAPTASLIEKMPVAAVAQGDQQTPALAVPRSAGYGVGSYAVHLASYRSKEETLDGWLRLRTSYPGLLRNLSGHFAIFDIASLGGRYYRLKAGPFEGAAGAQSLCRRLSSVGQYCVVSEFDGELLRE